VSEIPLYIAIPFVVFLVSGSLIALIGTLALVRLPNFYQRMHGPTVTITFGAACILIASMLYFSSTQARSVFHELLIFIFIVLTAPVVSMLLMRAAVYRDLLKNNTRDIRSLDKPDK